MDFKKTNFETFRNIILILMVFPFLVSSNVDCGGRAFHCVNTTHFMICVDLGGGVSSTIDNFIIPCPPSTVCRETNHFECEFPETTTEDSIYGSSVPSALLPSDKSKIRLSGIIVPTAAVETTTVHFLPDQKVSLQDQITDSVQINTSNFITIDRGTTTTTKSLILNEIVEPEESIMNTDANIISNVENSSMRINNFTESGTTEGVITDKISISDVTDNPNGVQSTLTLRIGSEKYQEESLINGVLQNESVTKISTVDNNDTRSYAISDNFKDLLISANLSDIVNIPVVNGSKLESLPLDNNEFSLTTENNVIFHNINKSTNSVELKIDTDLYSTATETSVFLLNSNITADMEKNTPKQSLHFNRNTSDFPLDVEIFSKDYNKDGIAAKESLPTDGTTYDTTQANVSTRKTNDIEERTIMASHSTEGPIIAASFIYDDSYSTTNVPQNMFLEVVPEETLILRDDLISNNIALSQKIGTTTTIVDTTDNSKILLDTRNLTTPISYDEKNTTAIRIDVNDLIVTHNETMDFVNEGKYNTIPPETFTKLPSQMIVAGKTTVELASEDDAIVTSKEGNTTGSKEYKHENNFTKDVDYIKKADESISVPETTPSFITDNIEIGEGVSTKNYTDTLGKLNEVTITDLQNKFTVQVPITENNNKFESISTKNQLATEEEMSGDENSTITNLVHDKLSTLQTYKTSPSSTDQLSESYKKNYFETTSSYMDSIPLTNIIETTIKETSTRTEVPTIPVTQKNIFYTKQVEETQTEKLPSYYVESAINETVSMETTELIQNTTLATMSVVKESSIYIDLVTTTTTNSPDALQTSSSAYYSDIRPSLIINKTHMSDEFKINSSLQNVLKYEDINNNIHQDDSSTIVTDSYDTMVNAFTTTSQENYVTKEIYFPATITTRSTTRQVDNYKTERSQLASSVSEEVKPTNTVTTSTYGYEDGTVTEQPIVSTKALIADDKRASGLLGQTLLEGESSKLLPVYNINDTLLYKNQNKNILRVTENINLLESQNKYAHEFSVSTVPTLVNNQAGDISSNDYYIATETSRSLLDHNANIQSTTDKLSGSILGQMFTQKDLTTSNTVTATLQQEGKITPGLLITSKNIPTNGLDSEINNKQIAETQQDATVSFIRDNVGEENTNKEETSTSLNIIIDSSHLTSNAPNHIGFHTITSMTSSEPHLIYENSDTVEGTSVQTGSTATQKTTGTNVIGANNTNAIAEKPDVYGNLVTGVGSDTTGIQILNETSRQNTLINNIVINKTSINNETVIRKLKKHVPSDGILNGPANPDIINKFLGLNKIVIPHLIKNEQFLPEVGIESTETPGMTGQNMPELTRVDVNGIGTHIQAEPKIQQSGKVDVIDKTPAVLSYPKGHANHNKKDGNILGIFYSSNKEASDDKKGLSNKLEPHDNSTNVSSITYKELGRKANGAIYLNNQPTVSDKNQPLSDNKAANKEGEMNTATLNRMNTPGIKHSESNFNTTAIKDTTAAIPEFTHTIPSYKPLSTQNIDSGIVTENSQNQFAIIHLSYMKNNTENSDRLLNTREEQLKKDDQNTNEDYLARPVVVLQENTNKRIDDIIGRPLNIQDEQVINIDTLTKPETSNVHKNSIFSFCFNRQRGRYSDHEDCTKFYVCIGRNEPIVGKCPVNTVFSDLKKQCTKNKAHCFRHNEFKCTSAGRYSDILDNNVYYVCVKNKHNFIRFKFQCQNGFYLNKKEVKCERALELLHQSISGDNSKSEISGSEGKSSTESKKSEDFIKIDNSLSEKFECKKVGKFPHHSDCRKYYICTKNKKSEFRKRRKSCDSDELFHKDKRKCVDADSYEVNMCT